jgi:hypothetical protein
MAPAHVPIMPRPTASIGTKIRVHTSSNAPFPPLPHPFGAGLSSPLPLGEGEGEGGRLLRKQFGDLIPSILRKGLKLTAVME